MKIHRCVLFFWAAVAMSFANVAFAGEPEKLAFSHFLGEKSFFQVDLVEPWARELERRSGGKVAVEIHNASSPLGNVRNQATQVEKGTIDIALGLRGAEGDRFWRSAIIELPFVVPDADAGSKALWELHTTGVLENEYGNFKLLALFVHNPGLVHTKDKRVVSLDDLKGLRLRVPNNTVSVALKSVDAVPVVLQPDQIIPALQADELDGIVTNWGTPIPGFNDHMKQHTAVPFYASAFFIVMNKDKYESLPSDVKAIIDDMSGDALVGRFGALWDQWDEPFFKGAHAEDHEIVRLSDAQLESWQAGLRPVTDRYLDDLVAKGFTNAREVHADLVRRLNSE